MADIETNIALHADGGDAASAEIMKAANALNATGESSGRLQEKFQERFQHIGLQLFAGDALRASGLGRETRQVIMLMNMAINEGGAAAGLSAGGFMLMVTALAAVAAIIVKVVEHQKDLNEQNAKLLESETKSLETIREKIGQLEGLEAATGHLNKVQQDYLDTLKEVGAEQAAQKNDTLIETIKDLNITLAQEKQHLDDIKATGHLTLLQDAKLLYESNAAAAANYNSKIADMTNKINDTKMALHNAEVEMNALHTTGTGTFKDVAKEGDAAAKHLDDVWKNYWKDVDEADKKTHDDIMKNLEAHAKMVGKVTDQIGSDFGNAFAKSLVEGKSFTDQMRNAFKNMAEQIISDIVRMIMEMAIFNAMAGMGGGVGGIGASLMRSHGFALGGQVMVDQPTMFLAGEGGPEMATFTPVGGGASGMGSSTSGGGDTNIGAVNVQVTVQGVNDPDAIAQQVGRKIVEQIRGAGQLSFVR